VLRGPLGGHETGDCMAEPQDATAQHATGPDPLPDPLPDVHGGRDPVDPFGTGPHTGPYGVGPVSEPYGLDLATPANPPAESRPQPPTGSKPPAGKKGAKPPAEGKQRGPVRAAFAVVLEVAVVLTLALGLSFLIKTFLVQAFSIPSGSMEDTLLIGDRVLVNKLSPGVFDLHRGDVVVFRDPGWLTHEAPVADEGPVLHGLKWAMQGVGLLPEDAEQHLIKRVIGLPGDTVTCCDAKGRLQVNGVSVDEPYVRAGNVPSATPFTAKVRPGSLWVMGDNRSGSADSRAHPAVNNGQVPLDLVVGRTFAIVWPFSRFGSVGAPAGAFSAVPAPSG